MRASHPSSTPCNADDFDAISRVMTTLLEGESAGDVAKLRSVFHRHECGGRVDVGEGLAQAEMRDDDGARHTGGVHVGHDASAQVPGLGHAVAARDEREQAGRAVPVDPVCRMRRAEAQALDREVEAPLRQFDEGQIDVSPDQRISRANHPS